MFVFEEVRGEEERVQRVAELVRHAARDLRHRREALRLDETSADAVHLREIVEEEEVAVGVLFGAARSAGPRLEAGGEQSDRHVLAGAVDEDRLARLHATVLVEFRDDGVELSGLPEQGGRSLTQQVAPAPAGHGDPGPVPDADGTRLPDRQDGIRGEFEEGTQEERGLGAEGPAPASGPRAAESIASTRPAASRVGQRQEQAVGPSRESPRRGILAREFVANRENERHETHGRQPGMRGEARCGLPPGLPAARERITDGGVELVSLLACCAQSAQRITNGLRRTRGRGG
jgi:hypothetical protein